MPICKKCNEKFPNKIEIDGKMKNIGNRKYCTTCSPWGMHNTRKLCDDLDACVCIECGKHFDYSRSKGHRKKICNSCLTHQCQRRKKEKAISYFGGKCSKCGYDKCLDALEFHHLGDKDESASYIIMRWSWKRAIKELNKCILVCCRCHREIHHELYKIKKSNILA